MSDPEPPADASVELVGQRRRRVDPADLADLPVRRRSVTVTCSTGSRETATWGGVPIPDLLSLGDVPPSTTHLVVGTTDGYAACVGVEAALEGLLAWTRDGRPIRQQAPYATRFVAPEIDGARLVKAVGRVEAVSLASGEDPADYETIGTDSPSVDGAKNEGDSSGEA